MGPGNTVLQEDLKRQREVENLNRDAIEWREQGGKYLRGLRNQKSMSQRELAERVGFAYYTKISAIENGKERIPPEYVIAYGKALGVPSIANFTKLIIKFYERHYHQGLNYDRKGLEHD